MTKRKRVIWTDHQGDALVHDRWADDEWVAGVTFDGGEAWCYLPTDHDDKVAVAAAFVDALGLECDGFRAKPRPFQVGDVVQVDYAGLGRGLRWTLLAVGDSCVFARSDTGIEEAWGFHVCTLITPAEEVEQGPEVEMEAAAKQWRYLSTLTEVIYALRAELDVEANHHTVGRWTSVDQDESEASLSKCLGLGCEFRTRVAGEVEQSEGEWRTPEEHELADAVRSGVLEFRFEMANTRRWSSWRPATGDAFGRHGYEYRVPAGWSA